MKMNAHTYTQEKFVQKYLLIPLSHRAVHKRSAFQVNYSKNLVYSNSEKKKRTDVKKKDDESMDGRKKGNDSILHRKCDMYYSLFTHSLCSTRNFKERIQ